MRYDETAFGLTRCQARSRRIGRCVRCHAPVLADEEHYEAGAGVVHGACGTDQAGTNVGSGAAAERAPKSALEPRVLEIIKPVRPRRAVPTSASVLAGASRRA